MRFHETGRFYNMYLSESKLSHGEMIPRPHNAVSRPGLLIAHPSLLSSDTTLAWRFESSAAVRMRWVCAVSCGITQEKSRRMPPGYASSSHKAAHICQIAR